MPSGLSNGRAQHVDCSGQQSVAMPIHEKRDRAPPNGIEYNQSASILLANRVMDWCAQISRQLQIQSSPTP